MPEKIEKHRSWLRLASKIVNKIPTKTFLNDGLRKVEEDDPTITSLPPMSFVLDGGPGMVA